MSYIDDLTNAQTVHGANIMPPDSGEEIMELRREMASLEWSDPDAAISGIHKLFRATTDLDERQAALLACRVGDPEAREIMSACLNVIGAGKRFDAAMQEAEDDLNADDPTG